MVPNKTVKPRPQLNRLDLVLLIVLGLGLLGMAVYGLGLVGWLKPAQTLVVIAAVAIGLLWYIKKKFVWYQPVPLTRTQKILITLISLQWLVYMLGVGVPDTSFDAVWYHLPEARTYAATGLITRLPGILYSTLPRLGEMFFTVGFLFGGAPLVRLFTFIFSVLFTLLSYALARQFLEKTDSLLLTGIVNSMFLIAWQSTAGYVDIIAAVFLLASLICLIRFSRILHTTYYILLAGAFAGFALGVKMQAAIALPASIVFLFFSTKEKLKIRILHTTYYLLLATLVASPWYLDNYLQTGSPLYPLNQPFKQQDQLQYSGEKSIKDWLIHQTVRLPTLPFHLALNDLQMTPAIILLLPLLLWQSKKLIKTHYPLYSYILIFLGGWWLLPPPEPRYALAVIPPLLTILLAACYMLHTTLRKVFAITIGFFIALNLAARVGITYKHLPVITGRQSPADYINTQTTDFNRDKIEKFYR